jgi:hypothetical protein
MLTIDDEIRSKTASFVAGLTGVIKQMALEAVETALGGGKHATPAKAAAPARLAAAAPRAKAAPAAPKKAVKAAPAAKAAAPAAKAPVSKKPAAAAAKRPFGAKRPPAELVKLTEKLGEYIKGHPGLRMEAIGKALATPTRELNLPIKKLLAAKKIRFEGHKRATEYFPV